MSPTRYFLVQHDDAWMIKFADEEFGPYKSKSEAMLFAAGATDRLGSTASGSSIGDSSPESRQRGGSTELNLYNFKYLDDEFALVDCPGSIGFAADGARAAAVADLAIVVVDPDPARAPLARPAPQTQNGRGSHSLRSSPPPPWPGTAARSCA